jgi:PAS domain S-box-containing protein
MCAGRLLHSSRYLSSPFASFQAPEDVRDGVYLGRVAQRRSLIGARLQPRPLGHNLGRDTTFYVAAMSIDDNIFRLLVEQTKDYAVFALDPNGVVITWNRGAELTKGYTAAEIIGRHFSIFYPREAVDRGWPNDELRIAAAEGHFEDEGWRVRKDGSRFWANVIITALRNEQGQLLGFSKITRDLTDRKTRDESLRQSEERFRLLVEGVTDYAIYMLDEDGIITSWNSGAERIKGYPRDEVIGTHFSRFYSDEDREAKPREELALARRMGRAESEGWRIKKSGERFWARAVVTPLHDAEGNLRGFAKLTQDLSERRHAEALEQASKRLTEFIAILAHELRNPLAPIRNAIHVLASHPPDDAMSLEMLRTIDRQSGQLVRIVDDLLDLSRVSKGLLSLKREVIDLAEVIQRSIETTTPLVDARSHQVTIDQGPDPVLVSGDINRLTQLLANLISNATRYTPEGGRIRIVLRKQGEFAELRVIDNGRGIAPEALESMFDMFVRERLDSEVAGGGLGIGLALARKIAELHGGTLSGFSEGVGRGAEFVLRLPRVAEHNVELTHAVDLSSALPQMQRQRVLVVDDNVDAATALGELLKVLGHQTLVCFDGHQALETVPAFQPDVIVLDIGMPGMSGLDVAKQIRANGFSNVRLVAITGWGQEDDRARSRAAGFDFHLVKPVTLEDLTAVLGGKHPSGMTVER